MKRTSIIVLALFAVLLSFGAARAETFTVDCTYDVPAEGGIHVVGAVFTAYDPVEDDVDLVNVQCSSVGGAGTPATPPNGVVGFCPSKDVPTTCNCHADVGPSETLGYCIQSPVDAPDLAELTTFVLLHDGEVVEEGPPYGRGGRGRGQARGHNK